MKSVLTSPTRYAAIFFLFFLAFVSERTVSAQQRISFGIHADPAISWFYSDLKGVKNNMLRPGFSFGLSFNRYFAPNYSFSTGISLMTAGGRLTSRDTTRLQFSNSVAKILPGESYIYRIQYLVIPIGLKLQTNQIGYVTFFSDLGFDPKIVIGGKADIPYLNIKGENADRQLRDFNMSYHIALGMEYSLGGTTALKMGLHFDNNFMDITSNAGGQPVDKVSHRILSLILGINF